MDAAFLHADRTRAALVHGARLAWQASPEPGVERRLLERIGGEVALATSIVRYRAGSRFGSHVHALGEEFLVLEGSFCDEHGCHPAGTYARNPPGSSHAPFSDAGCVIFVKLRQMHPADRRFVRVAAGARAWTPVGPGHEGALLHEGGGVRVTLERLHPGAWRAAAPVAGGEELFVVDGSIELPGGEAGRLEPWSWLRMPGGTAPALASPQGATCWIKRGHLRAGAAGDTVQDR